MKKTIIFSSALVALAMLASCQKEEFIETPSTAGVTEFTATIEQPTKTAIDSDGKVTWTTGDEITVTDAASKSAVYVAASSGESTTFTIKQGETAVGAGPYTATYGDITKQVYDANGANCPFSAKTTDASTKSLRFSSPYAVLKITAQSSGAEVIKKVVVTYGNSGSVLDCGEGVTLTSDGKVFYVAVEPANAALSVTFFTADKMAQKTRKSAVSLAAKDLLPVILGSFEWTNLKTFKAVYNTNSDANTLTFFYDAVDHSGEGITVYEDGTDKFLFDDTKNYYAKWGYNDKQSSIKSVVIDASVAGYSGLTSTAFMFQGMTAASDISGAEHLVVSNVTDMSYMFAYFGGGNTNSHTTLNSVPDVSKWNTANVTNMTGMFNSYGNFSDYLTKVPDVSNWNTGNVTNMSGMFQKYGHESQTFNAVPDVSKWNTGNVTDMASMFSEYGYSSTALTKVPDVSGWSTASLTNLSSMFSNYGGLKSGSTTVESNVEFTLDLSGWDLSKITGTNGKDVFNLKPETFNVTIPAKTGEKPNEGDKWYYGDGTNFITPPTNKEFKFTLAAN